MTDQPPQPGNEPQQPYQPPGYRPRPGQPPSYGAEGGYPQDPNAGGYGSPYPAGPQPGYGPPPDYGYRQQPGYNYGQQPGYGSAPEAPARATIDIGTLLGPRTRQRPEARFGPALAAGGTFLAVIGTAVWSIGYFADGFDIDFDLEGGGGPTVQGAGRRFLGAGLFLVLAVAGYVLVVLRRRGPLATAGTVASAASVPLLLGFAFLDLGGTVGGGALPINVDAVFLISILVWLASYFGVPGARGRAVYLGLAASGLYTYIAFKVGSESAIRAGATVFGGDSGLTPPSNHNGTVAALGLAFGLVYYLIAALLDRRNRGGAAIALVYAGFGATAGGLVAAAEPFGQIGIGVTLVVIGSALAVYGGWFGRRFTTWIWTAAAVLGVIVLVARIGLDRYVTIGIVLLAVGVLVVAGAPILARVARDRPDLDETRPGAAPA